MTGERTWADLIVAVGRSSGLVGVPLGEKSRRVTTLNDESPARRAKGESGAARNLRRAEVTL